MDTVQSPPQSQTQPQQPVQSFTHPPPALSHQPYSQVQSYSQISQLPPQPQSQNSSQTDPCSQTQTVPPAQSRPQHHSKSASSSSLSPQASAPHLSCSWARGVSRPPSVLLPRALYDIITASDSSGLPRCTSFLPHMSVAWASSFR